MSERIPFAHPRELIPHAGTMALLARVIEHDAQHTVCEARAADARIFEAEDGRVPNHVAVEWMAQTMAVHGRLAGEEGQGRDSKPAASPERSGPSAALLASLRRVEFACSGFDPAAVVRVEVKLERGGRSAAFACRVLLEPSGECVAHGRLVASFSPPA